MRFKTIYDTVHEKEGIKFSQPSMTVQSEKDNCDINVIMNRYATCGTPLPIRQDVEPVYADVAELGDYMENFQRCKQAEEMFNALPSALRKELDNNPLICYHLFRTKITKRGVMNMDYLIVQLRKFLKLLLLIMAVAVLLLPLLWSIDFYLCH